MRRYLLISLAIYIFSLVLSFPFAFGHMAVGTNFHYLGYENPSFVYLFENNLTLVLLLLVGAFSFGMTTFVNLIYNGFVCGLAISEALQRGIPVNKIALLILPHGIFEIPAIIIAGTAGFKIPYEIVRYLLGKKEQVLTQEDIKEYLTLALISIILIVIAAWIEANITLKIAKAMLNSTY